MLKNIITVLFVLLLSIYGCDNTGGYKSTPTDPNQSFSLSGMNSTAPGKVYSSKLKGRDSNGVNYTGSIFMANRAQTMFNGVTVIPKDFIISLSGGSNISMTVSGTSNMDTSGNLVSYVIQTTGQTCTPEAPYAMPETVKIGDFGILPAMTCSDNSTQERNWRVEDAKNGNINLVSNVTVKNQSNTIVSVADVISKINSEGSIVSFKIATFQPPINYRLTLNVVE